MSFVQKVIGSTGTEVDFIKTVVAEITALNSKITCDTNIDEQFATTSNIPTIIFDIEGGAKFTLKRQAALTSNATNYALAFTIKNSTFNITNVAFIQGTTTYTANASRSFNITYLGDDNSFVIYLSNFAAGGTALYTTASIIYIPCKDRNIAGYMFGTSTNATPTLYDCDTGSICYLFDGQKYSMGNKLRYTKSKAITNTSSMGGVYITSTSDAFLDCSSVSQYSVVTVDNKNYFAITTNTLIGISTTPSSTYLNSVVDIASVSEAKNFLNI